MKLRAHHLLCLQTFVGEGYSDAFCANMAEQKRRAAEENRFVLADGCDDICQACPERRGKLCRSREKVSRYDAAVIARLGLCAGEELSWRAVSERVRDEIFRPGLLPAVCGDCQWQSLCQIILQQAETEPS